MERGGGRFAPRRVGARTADRLRPAPGRRAGDTVTQLALGRQQGAAARRWAPPWVFLVNHSPPLFTHSWPWARAWPPGWTGVSLGATSSTATAHHAHWPGAGCTWRRCWHLKYVSGLAPPVSDLSSLCPHAPPPWPAGRRRRSTAASCSTWCRGTRCLPTTWRCVWTSWPSCACAPSVACLLLQPHPATRISATLPRR